MSNATKLNEWEDEGGNTIMAKTPERQQRKTDHSDTELAQKTRHASRYSTHGTSLPSSWNNLRNICAGLKVLKTQWEMPSGVVENGPMGFHNPDR